MQKKTNSQGNTADGKIFLLGGGGVSLLPYLRREGRSCANSSSQNTKKLAKKQMPPSHPGAYSGEHALPREVITSYRIDKGTESK